MHKQKNHLNKSRLLILSALAVAAVVGGFFLLSDTRGANQATNTTDETINLDPPTEEEKQQAENNKERIISEEEKRRNTTPSNSQNSVTPVIGYLRQASDQNVEANGYIPGVIETGGTCTLTLTKQGSSVTTSREAKPDAQNTVCGKLTIERSSLSPGDWTATISYSSTKYKGISQESSISIE